MMEQRVTMITTTNAVVVVDNKDDAVVFKLFLNPRHLLRSESGSSPTIQYNTI